MFPQNYLLLVTGLQLFSQICLFSEIVSGNHDDLIQRVKVSQGDSDQQESLDNSIETKSQQKSYQFDISNLKKTNYSVIIETKVPWNDAFSQFAEKKSYNNNNSLDLQPQQSFILPKSRRFQTEGFMHELPKIAIEIKWHLQQDLAQLWPIILVPEELDKSVKILSFEPYYKTRHSRKRTKVMVEILVYYDENEILNSKNIETILEFSLSRFLATYHGNKRLYQTLTFDGKKLHANDYEDSQLRDLVSDGNNNRSKKLQIFLKTQIKNSSANTKTSFLTTALLFILLKILVL